MDREREGARREASWPPGRRHADADVVLTSCPDCDLTWRVHRDLAGFRLECECGTWLEVPRRPVEEQLPEAASQGPVPVVRRSDAVGRVIRYRKPEPGQLDDGDLRHAPVKVQARWTNRIALELVLFMLAFLGPAIIVQLATVGYETALYMPLTALVGSALVLLIGLTAPGFAFSGLTRPRLAFVAEALGAAVVFVLLALAWLALVRSALPGLEDDMWVLRRELGLPMTLFVVAFCPGVFEELAFRGVIQGRVSRLLGATQGALVTGVIFALAHGVTLAFPIHVGIGIYLCFLRLRSRSLLPGILLHALYNGTLVVLASE